MADEVDDVKLAIKLAPKVEALEATLAKAHDQLREIRLLLAGGNPHGACVEFWVDSWKKKYRTDYVWNKPRDMAHIKRLLKSMSVDELKARMAVYLSIDDPFYERNQHPFSVFLTQVNSFTASRSRSVLTAVGCQHTPPCVDDVEHTRRIGAETRR